MRGINLRGNQLNQTVLKITGMTCNDCAQSAQAELNKLQGVQAQVSFETGLAEIESEKEVPLNRLIRAVERKGYRGEQISEDGELISKGGDGLHIAIIGSGSGAFAAALKAVEEGAHVVVPASMLAACLQR